MEVFMKKTIGIIVAVIAVFAISLGVILLINDDTAYVFLEVNPSLQLVVNKNDKVIEINALNEGAELLLSDLSLKNKDLTALVGLLTDEMIKLGFLSENETRLIDLNTVSAKEARNDRISKTLKKEISQKLEKHNIMAEINIGGVSEAVRESAEKYGISSGKMLLITKAVQAGSKYDEADLATMSVKKIQAEIMESKKDFNKSDKKEKEALRREKKERIKANKAKNIKESN